jgi:hypothetical protein
MSPERLLTQIERVDKASCKKGISFVTLESGELHYNNIPTLPEQKFVYLENTSKMTNAQRQEIYNKRKGIIDSVEKDAIILLKSQGFFKNRRIEEINALATSK